MREWKHTMSFSIFYHEDALTVDKKAELVLAKLKQFVERRPQFKDDHELLDITDYFQGEVDCEDGTDVECFDEGMAQLYDWADANNVWVETT